MRNVKELMGYSEPKPSNQPEIQEFIINKLGGQQHVQKSTLENHVKNEPSLHGNNEDFPESADNHLVYIGPGLVEYGRIAVMRDWDPNTLRVTEEERKILKIVSRRNAPKDKKM